MGKKANAAAKTGVVANKEFLAFMACAFFFTNMQGMAGNFRRNYLVDALQLEPGAVSFISVFTTVVSFVLSFFFAMIVDRAPKPGKDKFRPLVLLSAVPSGVFAILMFFTPSIFNELSVVLMITYQCAVTLCYNTSCYFAGTVNSIAAVITPDHQERDKVMSFRGIASAIGNSAPLVVVMVLGLAKASKDHPGRPIPDSAALWMISAALCAVASTLTLLLAMRVVKERITYSSKRVNPLTGLLDIAKNPYALLVMLSELLKNFRRVASYMGTFLAAALLGSPSKFLIFGLPTGIGTAVGMLVVNFLLKRFNSKQISIGSGFYSVVVNGLAFGAGALAFTRTSPVYTVVFIVFLFLVGLQYGGSNLLPSMIQADILEDLEVKTHRRLDASLAFAISVGTFLSGTVVEGLWPQFLYGNSKLNFMHYILPIKQLVEGQLVEVYQEQALRTKMALLGVYTLGQGVFMFLGVLPFLFYRLTGARKEEVHEAALRFRAEIAENQAE
ncbi:MAG: MFS transporter [Oscillospiraceae bacterium]|jgi:Na+/melibiose symporter-like transporter|nr:MFS transporter [Oscillospiraceae bacterium]